MGRTVNALEAGTTSPYVNALIELGDLVMKRAYSTWLFVNDTIYMTLAEDGRKYKRCLKFLHTFTREVLLGFFARLCTGNGTRKLFVQPFILRSLFILPALAFILLIDVSFTQRRRKSRLYQGYCLVLLDYVNKAIGSKLLNLFV